MCSRWEYNQIRFKRQGILLAYALNYNSTHFKMQQRCKNALALLDRSVRRLPGVRATPEASARRGTQVKVPEAFQVETSHELGSLASVLSAITETGLVLKHLSTVRSDQNHTLWEVTIEIDESAHAELLGRLNALPSVRFIGWSERVFDRQSTVLRR